MCGEGYGMVWGAGGVMCSSVDQHVVGLWYTISVTLVPTPPAPASALFNSVSADR